MLPQQIPLPLMQTQWAAQLNPLLANPVTQGSQLTGVKLIDGSTVINHLLGRVMQGWFITDQNAAASIYRPASAGFNATTLTLVSSAAVTVNIWVY